MAGSTLGSATCRICGAKVREDRVRCLRCGYDPTTAAPSARGSRLSLLALIVGGVVVAAFLAGLVLRRSQPAASTAAVPVLSPAPQGAIEPASASAVMAPVTSLDSTRVGKVAYEGGDVEGSFDHFKTAVDANPQDPDALNNLGQILVRTGKPADAIQYFDRAIAVVDTKWAYHFNRARAQALLGQWNRAVAGYRTALNLFPDDYATQFNLAKALEASGDLQAAIAGYERAITLAPGEAGFHLSHGRALEAAQRVPDAVAAYARFLELAPDAPEADKVKGHYDRLRAQGSGPSVPQPRVP